MCLLSHPVDFGGNSDQLVSNYLDYESYGLQLGKWTDSVLSLPTQTTLSNSVQLLLSIHTTIIMFTSGIVRYCNVSKAL